VGLLLLCMKKKSSTSRLSGVLILYFTTEFLLL